MPHKSLRLTVFALIAVSIVAAVCLIMLAYLTPRPAKISNTAALALDLHPLGVLNYQLTEQEVNAARRQQAIDRVQAFMRSYGSVLVPYAHIIVDQAQACGGSYRILVGIAGSESGLGRINVKTYNPYGYLDGVQYSSFEEALTVLSCKISQQFLQKCGEDLNCLVRRYAGPQDDPALFISKVAWFASQV